MEHGWIVTVGLSLDAMGGEDGSLVLTSPAFPAHTGGFRCHNWLLLVVMATTSSHGKSRVTGMRLSHRPSPIHYPVVQVSRSTLQCNIPDEVHLKKFSEEVLKKTLSNELYHDKFLFCGQ